MSTPLAWTEVEQAIDAADADLLRFEMDGVLERIEEHVDLFEPVLSRRQELEHAVRAGERDTPRLIG